MIIESARLAIVLVQTKQYIIIYIWVIFTHLTSWVARHNFIWVKMSILWHSAPSVNSAFITETSLLYAAHCDCQSFGHILYKSGNIREVLFSRIPREGQICEFRVSREKYFYNSATKVNENSQILKFVKSPKIRNSRKFKHAKIIRSTVVSFGVGRMFSRARSGFDVHVSGNTCTFLTLLSSGGGGAGIAVCEFQTF